MLMARYRITPFTQMRSILSSGILLLASALSSHAQSTFNPTIPAAGFNVFTRSAVQFTAGETHGPVATGGDVILAGSTIVSMNYYGYYPNGNGDAANYGLVIGGRVWYNSGNQTQLNRGQLRIGTTTGTTLYNVNSNATQTQVQLSPGALNASPNIQSNSTMPINGPTSANGLSFPAAFNSFQKYSATINAYPTTQTQNSNVNFLSMPPTTGGGSQTITIAAGKVNYLSVNATQFSALTSSGITYNFSRKLDSSTVVVFNVTASGTYNWSPAAFGGISDNSMGDGQYILYNFPSASRIDITGGRSTIGSILAPTAAIYKTGGNNAAGTIIADTFSMQYGEVHYAPFGGMLPGTSTALPITNLAINGNVSGDIVRLNWEASGNDAATNLGLERSNDGAAFTRIATLPAAQSGTWIDRPAVAHEKLYYRLRATDPSGTTRVSPIWTSTVNKSATVAAVTPNPFYDRLHIGASDSDLSWILVTAAGQTVRAGGSAEINGLGTLPAGTYYLRTTSGNRVTTTPLSKQ